MALGSVLLKSQAYYVQRYSKRTGDHSVNTDCSARAVVELPRSPYKKPYIPGCDEGVLSVSHQEGYVGCAHMLAEENLVPPQKVGFDIVMIQCRSFGGREASTQELLLPFRESFTMMEWECVLAGSRHHEHHQGVTEFFIRWGMKEAYTKALGMGMGIPFNSFDIVPLWDGQTKKSVLDQDNYCSLYDFIVENGHEVESVSLDGGAEETIVCHLRCKIVPDQSKKSSKNGLSQDELRLCAEEEMWRFWFIDLDMKPNKNSATFNSLRDSKPTTPFHSAVGCVAVGPFASLQETNISETRPLVKLQIEMQSIESLIFFHTNGSNIPT
mmetsp:Transcript_40410/g.47279  ORF Transcript_40410/g.47279 Transcript_40410/m.47279 type:complete len:326 (-) Transcript_40410:2-979(-)